MIGTINRWTTSINFPMFCCIYDVTQQIIVSANQGKFTAGNPKIFRQMFAEMIKRTRCIYTIRNILVHAAAIILACADELPKFCDDLINK